jgi:uncharacterized membrane protein YkvA (DUF1232 family)
MPNPIRRLLDQCKTGFTLGQKAGLTAAAFVYVISPIDLIPDVFVGLGECDDIAVLVLLFKVWCSPTLSKKHDDSQDLPPPKQ